jgi:hypothetical protein
LLLITLFTSVQKLGVLRSGKGLIEIEPALPALERAPTRATSRRGRHAGHPALCRTARRGRPASIGPRAVGSPLRTAIRAHSPRATRLTHAGWPHRPAPPDLWRQRRTPPRRAALGAHALTLDGRACGREPLPKVRTFINGAKPPPRVTPPAPSRRCPP